jgi:hypothetical protein
MIIFKNFFSYGLTYKAYDWILENKTKAQPVFNALGTVQLIVCLLSIPMCKCLDVVQCDFCVSMADTAIRHLRQA